LIIRNLTEGSKVYTANAWLVTGSWKTLSDLNTLVDAGMDPLILNHLEESNNGVGKKKVDQIILTHGHYDHAGMVNKLREAYNPKVMAFSESYPGLDRVLNDGDHVQMGDRDDSICLYCRKDGVLFAGDSPLVIITPASEYTQHFIQVLDRLSRLPIHTIYFGHGQPLTERCNEVLKRSLSFAKKTLSGGFET
jgi:glyoxylase-like metal-dependent hydrolase (beta-lactamase superfamily II)